jgi:crotonobetainyl-CoA:carnitine CoA-transferase CaiB-like acyl-CoA transferase
MSALAGVRVIDAATFVSGPWAAMMLADLGAEVVKVEPPGGDPYRRFGRQVNGAGVMFANANRNKRCVVIDLKSDDGRADMLSLLGGADVLITNWRPGVAEELGLSASSVRALNPTLVWCRISGFGPDGPSAGEPAFDSVIQARSGVMFAQGARGEPEVVRGYLADKVAALLATQSILAALVGRSRSGHGEVIDLPMLDSMAYFLGPDLLARRTLVDEVATPAVDAQVGALRAVAASDGWVLVSPVRAKQLRGMLAAVGHPEWEEAFRSDPDPASRAQRIFDLLGSVSRQASTREWLDRFSAHDVPAAVVLDIDGHLADPQVEHNGTYMSYDHPRLGRIRQPRHPSRWMSSPPQREPQPAPELPGREEPGA